MVQDWLLELLRGTGRMFVHPIFYFLLMVAAILGVQRVKRERRNFHTRVEDAYFELRQLFPLGFLLGGAISIITIALGLVIPFAAVVLMAAMTVLWGLTTKVRFLSPAYIVGASFFALLFFVGQALPIPFFSDLFTELDRKIYPAIGILLALLLIAEGLLIIRNGPKATSPKLIISKRGQRVGIHETKRIWAVPIFLFIPGDALTLPFDWWPIFAIGEQTYSLLLVPFAVGFHQQIQAQLPREAIQIIGKRVFTLGLLVAILSAGGYWQPLVTIAAVVVAIIGREILTERQRISEENLPFFFSKQNHAVMILGILPNSPADKMALQVGELIIKVNGTAVNNETDFYEAIVRNRAHCKLEVIDNNGQIRFVQRALYEGDHHELGILFVLEEKIF